MTIYVGGLRKRLIRESLYRTINDSLDLLGWFDSGRYHSPITFTSEPVKDFQKVEVNTGALADLDHGELDDELGSLQAIHRWTMYFDFFGENDAVSLHIAGDVKDIMGGRMPSIGRSDPSLTVLDYTQATPPELFTVQVESIIIDRPTVFDRQFQAHWYTVRFDLVDYYGTEDDS